MYNYFGICIQIDLLACLFASAHTVLEASTPSCKRHPNPSVSTAFVQTKFGRALESSGKQPQTTVEVEEALPENSLHRIVGEDGVLMISMSRESDRFRSASAKLGKVGIHPTFFQATDGLNPNTSQEVLESAIHWPDPLPRWVKLTPGTTGARGVQALAHSHMRALKAAQRRSSEWTAILEDDAIPVWGSNEPALWSKAFEAVWAKLPRKTRLLVRLGYCQLKGWRDDTPPSRHGMIIRTYADGGRFRITRWTTSDHKHYQPGGCTTAYMVHKDVIPEMLALFPCASTLDSCWNKHFITKSRGLNFLVNIETHESPDEAFRETDTSKGWSWKYAAQFGILKQDWDTFKEGTTARSLTDHNKALFLNLDFLRANDTGSD